MDLAGKIDHTLLKAQAVPKDIDRLCKEAVQHHFAAVCVNPLYVERAAANLKGSRVAVATVAGFPLGAHLTTTKIQQVREARRQGAGEIDMVMAIGSFLGGDTRATARDIREVVLAAGPTPVKVIIETCYLSPRQVREASLLAADEGAAFIKTSTGFGTRGASVEDIRLIKETVGDRCGIKASGGIRDYDDALAMVEAGATRIGTSAGVDIVHKRKKERT